MQVLMFSIRECSATGMEPQLLKQKYGCAISFWGGGIDTQKLLPFGTPAQIREQVKQCGDLQS